MSSKQSVHKSMPQTHQYRTSARSHNVWFLDNMRCFFFGNHHSKKKLGQVMLWWAMLLSCLCDCTKTLRLCGSCKRTRLCVKGRGCPCRHQFSFVTLKKNAPPETRSCVVYDKFLGRLNCMLKIMLYACLLQKPLMLTTSQRFEISLTTILHHWWCFKSSSLIVV